ncbi:MAG: MarR family transcriptional regulator [Bauldia litoralis]
MPDAQPKTFDIRDFMPYLVARVGSLMAQSFAPPMEAAGITLDMWRVLMVLHFNGPLTLIEISRNTGVKTSTLSRLVGRMADKRLVTRRRSRQDARTVQISLRREGEAMFQDLWPAAAWSEDIVTAPFSAADVERLKAMLREIETILVAQVDAAAREARDRKDVAAADG